MISSQNVMSVVRLIREIHGRRITHTWLRSKPGSATNYFIACKFSKQTSVSIQTRITHNNHAHSRQSALHTKRRIDIYARDEETNEPQRKPVRVIKYS